jgi:hypothetical protein
VTASPVEVAEVGRLAFAAITFVEDRPIGFTVSPEPVLEHYIPLAFRDD